MITNKETGAVIDPAEFRNQMLDVKQSFMANMTVDFDARTITPDFKDGAIVNNTIIGAQHQGISIG